MEWAYENGWREAVSSVDRGRMLAYSEDEWLHRFKRQGGQFSVLFFVVVTPILMAILGPEVGPLPGLVALAAGVASSVVGYYLIVIRHVRTGRALPGVYENGVELTFLGSGRRRAFLPYGEVETASWERSLFRNALVLQLRQSGKRVTLNPEFYGLDGPRLVEDIIRGEEEPVRPSPRLVIYGPGGRS